MPQDKLELGLAFNEVKRLAEQGTWRPTPVAPVEMRLTTVDSPDAVSLAAVTALVDYARQMLGVDLDLCGGGFGCFDMGFTAELDQGEILDQAILNDPRFQNLLNDLNTHTALIRTQGSTLTYCAFYELKIALATNRQKQSGLLDEENGVTSAFGDGFDKKMWYGLAEVHILDLSRGQPRAGFFKRVWRRLALGNGELRAGTGRVIVRKIDLLNLSEFKKLISGFRGNGAIVMVHGYANNFDDAVRSSARSVYKTKIDELALLPVLFSWPSRGKKVAYFPDTAAAEDSEYALQDLLGLVSKAVGGREIDILAHSHGNKILVRSLCTDKHNGKGAPPHFKRLILVEADVGENFLQERIARLAESSDQIIIYHSENDRALWGAEFFFDKRRAGQAGISVDLKELPSLADRLEIIDASLVATGLSKHAPHIDVSEVIGDIYQLLRGMKPADRFNLRMVNSEVCRWKILPV